MDGKSEDILKGRIKELKKLFPEVITEGKIDFEQLKATLGVDLNSDNERYMLNWAGKAEAFRVLQQPTTATLAPAVKESVDFNNTENIFIEGENLEVLKVLQKSYYGKIKMIYIDPPYNTGNDSFIYPDKFAESKEEYLKRIGEKDEEGYLLKEGLFRKNSKENGQFHSVWLSMMYPRLFLARNLLRDDGVIFISIDDNEVHNLRMVMNEIFGEENFLATINWEKVYSPRMDEENFSTLHDYILVYKKSENAHVDKQSFEQKKEQFNITDKKTNKTYRRRSWRKEGSGSLRSDAPSLYFPLVSPDGKNVYPIKPDGTESRWRGTKATFNKMVDDEVIEWIKNDNKWEIYVKQFYEGTSLMPQVTIWSHEDAGHNHEGNDEMRELLGGRYFDNPKPSRLIQKILKTVNEKDFIILDFFAGSGTTANAVMDLNKNDGGKRKYISVQLPEKCASDSEAYKAGYKTIAELGIERIRRVIKKVKQEIKENKDLFNKDKLDLDLGLKVFKLKYSNFKVWRSDVIGSKDDLAKQMDMFQEPVKPGAEMNNMMWELLVKNGYELTTKVEEREISKCPVQIIAGGELLICLSKLTETTVKELVKLKPKKIICLDSLFEQNDKLKTNTSLQLRDAEIEFKTI